METVIWKRYRLLWEYAGVTAGVVITALGLVLFLIPGKIAAGGVSGFAIIIFHLLGINVGITMLAVNIPLFLLGIKKLGGLRFGLKGIYGAVLLSILTDFFAYFLDALTDDPILATLYGGALVGVGLGIVVYFGGTTGGTILAAQLLQKHFRISVGHGLLAFDALVIMMAGIVFSIELALYAIIALLLTVKVIDFIQEGVGYAKAAIIISDKSDEIKSAVLKVMDRGATLLKGEGAYTGEKKEVLLVVISRTEVSSLKSLINQIDPQAFVILTSVNEAIGEGFKDMKKEN